MQCSDSCTHTQNSTADNFGKTILELVAEYEVLNHQFEIEKNAKNKAYSFILEKDLLDKFKAFCHQLEKQKC